MLGPVQDCALGASAAHPQRVKSSAGATRDRLLLLQADERLHVMADSDTGGAGALPKQANMPRLAPPGAPQAIDPVAIIPLQAVHRSTSCSVAIVGIPVSVIAYGFSRARCSHPEFPVHRAAEPDLPLPPAPAWWPVARPVSGASHGLTYPVPAWEYGPLTAPSASWRVVARPIRRELPRYRACRADYTQPGALSSARKHR